MKFYYFWLTLLTASLALEGMQTEDKPNTQKTALHDAADKEDLEQVKVLLTNGANVNAQDESLMTPLHYAAGRVHLEIIDLLINRNGIDLEKKDIHGRTPLHVAAQFGSIPAVQALIKVFNINAKDKYNRTPLHLAIHGENLPIVEILLNHKTDINSSDIENTTPLHLAVNRGNKAIVKLLLDHGANLNAQDNFKEKPLSYAIMQGNTPIAKLLISYEMDVNYQNTKGKTPLHSAAAKGFEPIVKALLDKKANVDTVDDNGWTPLHYALIHGHKEIFLSLLARYPRKINDPIFHESKIGKGTRFLHFAAAEGSLLATNLLLSLPDSNINCTDDKNNTSLHYAAEYGHEETIEALLAQGALNNLPNKKGMTPLYLSFLNDHDKAAQLLLKAGVNSNELINGKTMLHLATQYGHQHVVKKLLASGASAKIALADGTTPLQIATKNGHESLGHILLPVNDIATLNSPQMSPLNWAAQNEKAVNTRFDHAPTTNVAKNPLAHDPALKKILDPQKDTGSSLNNPEQLPQREVKQPLKTLPVLSPKTKSREVKPQPNLEKAYDSVFFEAIREGNLDQIKYLLAEGANINAQNEKGQTALHEVIEFGDHHLATCLCTYHALNPNLPSKPNYLTPLHIATMHPSSHLSNLFVEMLSNLPTVDVNVRNREGKTPLDLAYNNKRNHLIPLLLHHGAQLGRFDLEMRKTIEELFQDHPLLLAVFLGKIDHIDKLAREVSETTFKEAMLLAISQGKYKEIITKLMILSNTFIGSELLHESFIDHAHLMVARCRDEKMLKSYQFILVLLRKNFVNDEKLKSPPSSSTQPPVQNTKTETQSSQDSRSPIKKEYMQCKICYSSLDDATTTLDCKHIFHEKCIAKWKSKETGCPVCQSAETATAFVQSNLPVPSAALPRIVPVTPLTGDVNLFLLQAARRGDIEHVIQALQNRANIDTDDMAGRTPLHFATTADNPALVNLLLNNGADSNKADKQGRKPIHHAALQGNCDILRLLISQGASPNSRDEGNKTPLHYAAMEDQCGTIEYLLSEGANVNALDNERRTPLSYALQNNNSFTALVLLNYGAVFNDNDKKLLKSLLTAAHWLIIQGDVREFIQYCNKKREEIPWLQPFSQKELERVLLLALGQRRVSIVKFLLDHFEISTDQALLVIAVLLKKEEQSFSDMAAYRELKSLLDRSPSQIQNVPHFLHYEVTSWFNRLPKELLPFIVSYFLTRKV